MLCGAQNPVGAGRYDVHKADASRHVWAHESDFRSLTLRADPKADNILKCARLYLSFVYSPQA